MKNQEKDNLFANWIKSKSKEAEERGEKMFLGTPDSWYEQGLHCCRNGHVNSMYLKSEERGAVCLSCGCPSYIFPTGITVEEFGQELIDNEIITQKN